MNLATLLGCYAKASILYVFRFDSRLLFCPGLNKEPPPQGFANPTTLHVHKFALSCHRKEFVLEVIGHCSAAASATSGSLPERNGERRVGANDEATHRPMALSINRHCLSSLLAGGSGHSLEKS